RQVAGEGGLVDRELGSLEGGRGALGRAVWREVLDERDPELGRGRGARRRCARRGGPGDRGGLARAGGGGDRDHKEADDRSWPAVASQGVPPGSSRGGRAP